MHDSGAKDRALLDDGVETGRASVLSCVINLSATCMGTGILALPFALSKSGFIAGCLLLFISAAGCALSLHFLVCGGRAVVSRGGPITFATLCEAALGPYASVAIDLSILVNCLGTATSYLIVAADCFSVALSVSRFQVVLMSLLLVSPAAFFRTMDTLKASSSVAICCLLGIVVMVLVFGFAPADDLDPCPEASSIVHGHCGGRITLFSTSWLHVFCQLPFFVMAFTCQQNAFNAIGELRRPTKARQALVVICAPILPLILYLTISICGYLTFGHRTPSNIIKAYPDTALVSAARCVLGVVVLCNFPLQMYPCRVSGLSLIAACTARPIQKAAVDNSLFISDALEICVCAAFLLATGGTALIVTDLGQVVAVIGSTGSTIVSLICPAAAFLLLSRANESAALPLQQQESSPRAHAQPALQAAAFLMLGLGLAVLPSSLFCS